jgi:biopolymer transport protein ExbD
MELMAAILVVDAGEDGARIVAAMRSAAERVLKTPIPLSVPPATPPAPPAVRMEIGADNTVTIKDAQQSIMGTVPSEQLYQWLRDRPGVLDGGGAAIIASSSVPHEVIIGVLDALKAHGVTRLQFPVVPHDP